MEEQTARRFSNFETIELVLNEILMNSQIRGEQIGQEAQLPGETTQVSRFTTEKTQASRFTGTGRLDQ